ncbi:hypothetical protein Cgig2_009182 [Carnegiea gigantea]|uniref:Uncharacterized protein n=1 Tax=Carnegiea gigantea TaxID=171969 RepID=A0A9Q1KF82_9CARY|nr:hypothetical protein Cgig2_009182 [Carnegiea gigantea]
MVKHVDVMTLMLSSMSYWSEQVSKPRHFLQPSVHVNYAYLYFHFEMLAIFVLVRFLVPRIKERKKVIIRDIFFIFRRQNIFLSIILTTKYISYCLKDHLVMEQYCPTSLDILVDVDFNILLSSKNMLGLHEGCIQYEMGSEENEGNSFDENVLRDNGTSSSKLKLKIVQSQKPLKPSILAIEDNTPCRKILQVGVTILDTQIYAIPIQSVAMATKALDEARFTTEPTPTEACR